MSDDDCCEIVVPVRRKRRPQQRDDHLHKQEAMITKSAVRPCPRKQVLDSPQQSSLQSNSPPINNDFIEVTKVAEEPDNPFASFAFGEEGIALKSLPAKKRRAGDAPSLWKPQESSTDTTKTTVSAGSLSMKTTKNHAEHGKKQHMKGEDISSMTPDDQRAFRRKWRAMADCRADNEDRRFQVLVGAILSSRAQASVVNDGLQRLRSREGGLTVRTIGAIEQEELSAILQSIHWNKAKAKYIREGANIILRQHRGIVPWRKTDLLALPGVGPMLGEILLAVFESWEADNASEEHATGNDQPASYDMM